MSTILFLLPFLSSGILRRSYFGHGRAEIPLLPRAAVPGHHHHVQRVLVLLAADVTALDGALQVLRRSTSHRRGIPRLQDQLRRRRVEQRPAAALRRFRHQTRRSS